MNFIIASNMSEKIVYKLESFGNIYTATTLKTKDKAVNYHPDLQIHFLTDTYAICPSVVFDHYRASLPKNIILEKGNMEVGITYPENCAYNIARVGNNIICNTKISDTKIIDYYTKNGFNILNVKQGYAKCNIAPIGNDLFITEDRGIYKKAAENHIGCILIHHGCVALDGFEYGFIGGATGYCENKLLLCGKLPGSIRVILDKYNIEFIELSDCKLTDYGSIISFG